MANINFIRLGAVLGALTVVIGAFGAHGLKPHLSEYQIAIYEKGVQYQFYHCLAILAVGMLLQHMPDSKGLRQAGWLFLAGILCFSGSLYLLACRDIISIPVGWAGPVTPIGGVLFIAGWLRLAWR
ncbi:MAG TPA: DUF423 domain-containing protein [Saprospiraceae bacterium]|nr:DUF423 domain-containing protein [Saprospiraceae bacterium]